MDDGPLLQHQQAPGNREHPAPPQLSAFALPLSLQSATDSMMMRMASRDSGDASSFAFADDMEHQSTSEDQNLHDDAASSPTGSSESSKEKWHKRHVCDIPDCGKSFDSKWALIRGESVCMRAPNVLQDVLQPQELEETHSVMAQPGREKHLHVRLPPAHLPTAVCGFVAVTDPWEQLLSLLATIMYREQQLRERIIKMATRNKEKTRKFEATIRNLMDENEMLKRRLQELEKTQVKRS